MSFLKDLREQNEARAKESFNPAGYSNLYYANAAAGEMGEVCNVIKKMERLRLALDKDAVKNLPHEIADVIIYLDLLAANNGIDLEQAVREKFNIVSHRVDSPRRL